MPYKRLNMKTLLVLSIALAVTCVTHARTYLVSFHSPDALLIVDEAGEVLWKAEVDLPHPQDCAVTDSGEIVTSVYRGLVALGLDQQVQWRYEIPKGTENPLAYPLGNDRFLVGLEGPTQLREVNKEGEVLKEIQLNTTHPKVHAQFRGCRKTSGGTYLVPFYMEGAVREYNGAGEVVRDFGKFRRAMGALRLENGNTLISYFKGIVEIDPSGAKVWEFVPGRIAEFKGLQPAGLAQLKNGNIIAKFYHSKVNAPCLIEITPEKEIVTSLFVKGYRKIGHFQVLTDDFKPSPEVLLR